jgi:hypothetical protein
LERQAFPLTTRFIETYIVKTPGTRGQKIPKRNDLIRCFSCETGLAAYLGYFRRGILEHVSTSEAGTLDPRWIRSVNEIQKRPAQALLRPGHGADGLSSDCWHQQATVVDLYPT